MNILIKSAKIIDSESAFNDKTQDILVEKNTITKIADSIKNTHNYREIKLENLHISRGWFDSSVSFGEPGLEERETIANGLNVAAKSGFTAVILNANNQPVVDSSADISYVLSKAYKHAVKLYPLGALTKESKGLQLSEMYDMRSAGAIAFYDYQKSIPDANLMKIALQYSSTFGSLVFAFPQDNSIAKQGVMHEHTNSTSLGLKGIPSLAEELQIARDLSLLEYTNGKLHIPTISTAKSVALVREAKAKGLDVSCSVAVHNLALTDDYLKEFDTKFKVLPPLRTQDDIDALLSGLNDRTIDMVTSDHNPIDIEHKKIEFDYALHGTIGLESAFGAMQNACTLKKTIDYLTRGKKRFDLESPSISIGNTLDTTLFNPKESITFSKEHILSKSKNAIFEGSKLKGSVYGIIANGKAILN
jgi:dihydroorotase